MDRMLGKACAKQAWTSVSVEGVALTTRRVADTERRHGKARLQCLAAQVRGWHARSRSLGEQLWRHLRGSTVTAAPVPPAPVQSARLPGWCAAWLRRAAHRQLQWVTLIEANDRAEYVRSHMCGLDKFARFVAMPLAQASACPEWQRPACQLLASGVEESACCSSMLCFLCLEVICPVRPSPLSPHFPLFSLGGWQARLGPRLVDSLAVQRALSMLHLHPRVHMFCSGRRCLFAACMLS